LEKNIDTIYYPEVDLKTYKETGRLYFNRQFVLSHLSGVMPDVKKRLQSRKPAVSGSLPLAEDLLQSIIRADPNVIENKFPKADTIILTLYNKCKKLVKELGGNDR
jgi:hypothetical protein